MPKESSRFIQVAGENRIVVASNKGRVRVLAADTGKQIAGIELKGDIAAVPTIEGNKIVAVTKKRRRCLSEHERRVMAT